MSNSQSLRIVILGAGPAGLYAALLIKKANPAHEIVVIERNPADVTYGWGVVFSDRTLASFQRADYRSYEQITENFVIWDAIDVKYSGETVRCGGHVIAAISRTKLLDILQKRCAELRVEMKFNCEIGELDTLPPHDLLIAADGINSTVRKLYEGEFKPAIEFGRNRYIWLGAEKVLDAFNFIFHENEHGFFTTHAYPFSGTTSTFIVECTEESWTSAGLDKASEAESLTFCQALLAPDLGGVQLLSNNSKWISFPTLKTRHWSVRGSEFRVSSSKSRNAANLELGTRNSEPCVVLVGDAAHTAHFSIGSGTKLAMEDAIALANALERHDNIRAALNEYELERKPVVETFQRAAGESQSYFETIRRYTVLEPVQFAFQLLTRSGRISYDDLHFRDARFGDMVDRWHTGAAVPGSGFQVPGQSRVTSNPEPGTRNLEPVLAPPPIFARFRLRELELANRVVVPFGSGGWGAAGLVLAEVCAVSPEGRVSPDSPGMYDEEHAARWKESVEAVHAGGGRIAAQIGHAGRRGSTRPRAEGLDRPLREGGWPLISASAIPYSTRSQVPREMDRGDMDAVREQFVRAACMANEAGFDLLQLHFAHGYLLASFLSPLTNVRTDDYGGSLEKRMRYPLELFDAVRKVWPEEKPLSVAVPASDCAPGGWAVEDAVEFARELKAHGCDLVEVLAGQTTPQSGPVYGRGFLTAYADRVRNEAGIAVMVGGYLTTSNDMNTVLAAGKADLCVMYQPS